MQAAGVGFVTLGVFSWALLEPRPGEFDFGWLDEVVDLLARRRHRDRHGHGDRRAAAVAHHRPPGDPPRRPRRAHALAGQQAVVVPQLAGLPGARAARSSSRWRAATAGTRRCGCGTCPTSWAATTARCWCDVSAAAFRRWLADRYGDIDEAQRRLGHRVLEPALHDVRRGAAAADHACGAQPDPAAGLRAASPPTPCSTTTAPNATSSRQHSTVPVTTNFMIMAHQSEQDYFAWAPEMDVVSQDHYLDHRLPHPHAEQAFADDLTRGVAGGSWLLMESATSAVNWQPVNVAKRPGELLVDSLRHVARGADGVGFFQWRASRAGGEKFHSALVPHAGPDSARFREVVALGAALKAIGEVAGAPVAADVALLWDWNAWWACDLDSHPSGALRYVDAPHRWHRALTELGATVDVVHPAADLSAYRLVIVPTLYLCSDALAPALEGVVARGGHVLVTYFSGIVDEQDHVRLGGYPGAFRALLGVRSEEFAPLRSSR